MQTSKLKSYTDVTKAPCCPWATKRRAAARKRDTATSTNTQAHNPLISSAFYVTGIYCAVL